MKKPISLLIAFAFLLATVVTPRPARAEGGAITLAIIAGVIAVASIKCSSKQGDNSVESLCWLSPLHLLGVAQAAEPAKKKGNIKVKPRQS